MLRLSFKVKLLLLFSLSTSLVLAVYAGIALKDFEQDKITSILDSGLEQSRFISNQTRTELENKIDKLKLFLKGYTNTRGYHSFSESIFEKDESFSQLQTFSFNAEKIAYGPQLKKGKVQQEFSKEKKEKIILSALNEQISISPILFEEDLWALAIRFKNIETNQNDVVLGYFKSPVFTEALTSSNTFDTYLIKNDQTILASPINPLYTLYNDEKSQIFTKSVESLKAPNGVLTEELNNQKWLIAASRIGIGNLYTISIIPQEKSMDSLKVFVFKSALFLAMLIFITLIVGVLFSSKMTYALKNLTFATQKVSEGDFDVNVNHIKSGDEIGTLAKSFSVMTTKIKQLIEDTAEKARMEEELKTAQTVQSSLFPESNYISKELEVRGFYQPASECSGDWWYYTRVENKFYFWIGDATGHGVPAALVTSAAKSAAAVIEEFPDLSVSRIVELFNKSVCQTSKGKVLMTFFMGCYDLESGKFTYTNASHDPPYLLSKKDEPLKKRDIQPLLSANGKRLGDDPTSKYEEETIQLKSGDFILFYTDGVTELMNSDGDMLGERKLIKNLLNSYNENQTLEQKMIQLDQLIQDFKGEEALADDCTYFMFEKIA